MHSATPSLITNLSRLQSERRFFVGMGCTALIVVFVGFAPSYFLRGLVDAGRPLLPLTPLIHLHGLLFSGWIVLFVAQTGLVAAGRTDLHRRLGVFGAVLAIAMIAVGALTALHGVARVSGPPTIPPLTWLAVPLFDLPVFALLVGVGIRLRRNAQTHKRLLLIATIGLMGPALGRMSWPDAIQAWVAFLPVLFLIPLLLWDLASIRRPHIATVLGLLLLVSAQALRSAVWRTDLWLEFAAWAAGLVA